LSGQITAADLVVEDLGCGAGQGAHPAAFKFAQESGERAAEGLGALPDFERRERV